MQRNKMKLTLLSVILLVLSWSASNAQQQDTIRLSFTEFIQQVKTNHPVSKQAELLLRSAEASMLAAKGNFDPKLFYGIDQKQFDDNHYWTIQDGGIKIPTSFGVELTTGIEQSSGPYLNNESITSTDGLVYTQISLPLLQGLLIDERRYAIRQARLMMDMSALEQKNILNALFSKASTAYWDWVRSYYHLQVIRESVALARQRFEGIKQAALLGDNAMIDTLEAGLQLQDRNIMLQQQEMDFYAKTVMLSVYLWNDTTDPVLLSSNTIPSGTDDIVESAVEAYMQSTMDSLVSRHPELRLYENKSDRLELELRLKEDKLKPILNVKFNPLYEIGNLESNIFTGVNNFKWGIGFQFPLLLRKERGEVKMAQLKLSDLNYEQQFKKAEISGSLRASFNDYSNTQAQIEQYEKVVNDYYRLLEAERQLFNIGESSLFMVNNREISYIHSRLKLNDFEFKLRKAAVDLLFNAGQLYEL